MKKFKIPMSILCTVSISIAICISAFAAMSIVGVKFTATSDWTDMYLETTKAATRIKIWVYCDKGAMDTMIVDENGNTIRSQQTLVSNTSEDTFVAYFDRAQGYTDDYILRVRSTDGNKLVGWYNWIEDK